jgi:peptidoglycan/xylan/chitin deacetylase (PgdA/CDA1 family)
VTRARAGSASRFGGPSQLCGVSVDLDELPHYFELHGLVAPPPGAAARTLVYDVALGRIDAFARALDLPLTLFAVGEDLRRTESAARLRVLAECGHAIENHSLEHRYDLTRLGRAEITRQIAGGAQAIEQAMGRRPTGFRAPGYTITDEVFDVLGELEVRFDSSVFPCPAYYGAKAAVLAAQRLLGRRSAAILDTPRVLGAPTRPYRPGRPYHRPGARGLVELPIQVTPGWRLPFIGTSLALAGPVLARSLARQCSKERFVNLELHGLDFIDLRDAPDLRALAKHQPELRRPVEERLLAIEEAVRLLRAEGFGFVRLVEAAARVS